MVTATVSTPQNQAFANLEYELAYQAENSRHGAQHWLYIELHGTLDDLADSSWVQYASAQEVAYKTTRADALRSLINRWDAKAGVDVTVPLDHRLARFYHGYLLQRA